MMLRTVFLSSSVKDLAIYRDAAHRAIQGLEGYHCVRMEDFGAVDRQADDFCRAKVRECELFVGIIGHLYGSCPPCSEQSYTEREYDAAVALGIPRLLFLAPDHFPLPANVLESDVARQKQRAFRQRLGSERILDTFSSPEDLFGRVARAIHSWERQIAVDGTLTPVPALPPAQTMVARRFLYAKVTASGLLDMDLQTTPYDRLADATDPCGEATLSSVFAFLWFPNTQQIHYPSPPLPFTPAAAICVPDPRQVLQKLSACLAPVELAKLEMPTRDMRPEEKIRLLTAMRLALPGCFMAAVTVPELIVSVGRCRPEMAYQAFVNLFVVPLLQVHCRLGIRQFHGRLSHVGEQDAFLLGAIKKVVKASYVKKGTTSIDFVGKEEPCSTFINLARLFAWAVAAFHNHGDARWITLLEDPGDQKSAVPSPLEGSAPV